MGPVPALPAPRARPPFLSPLSHLASQCGRKATCLLTYTYLQRAHGVHISVIVCRVCVCVCVVCDSVTVCVCVCVSVCVTNVCAIVCVCVSECVGSVCVCVIV